MRLPIRLFNAALVCLLTAAPGPLAAQPAVDWQPDIVYGQRGGTDLKLDLARPGGPGGRYPLVVCIHGGGWRSGSKSEYHEVLRMLASHGYAAVSLEYRFAPRYPFPAQMEDVGLALGYLGRRSAELGIDVSRTALLGESAGGHLALLSGLGPAAGKHSPVRIRAIVNVYGVSDLSTWKPSPEVEKADGTTADELLKFVFGTSDRNSEVLRNASPIRYVRRGAPAVLSLHGDADPVVPLSQSRELHAKLRQAGVEERLEIFPRAGHNFVGADLQRAAALVLEHAGRYLKGAVKPAFQRIDAHAHLAPPPEAFLQMLDRLNVRVLNVTLIDPFAPGFEKPEPQTAAAIEAAERSEGRIAWVSAMDPGGSESAGFTERESQRLETTFGRGAVGVKMYKSIGLQVKSPDGKYLLPDDPSFAPVLEFVARKNKTLLAHLAEPKSSWLPLTPADPHYGYYKSNPAWHPYEHPEMPSWESIIAGRDRMLSAHPRLRVVGCHLGSMEHDLDEIAKRLDKYPNFVVDTAARVANLKRLPREKVRAFMLRYQDRVLWGTDMEELDWKGPAAAVRRWEAAYENDWRYFATAETIPAGRGNTVQGLDLPEPVLRKIFRENTLRWIPDLAAALKPRPARGQSAEVAQVLARYTQALGGEAALRKVTSRAFKGSFLIVSYAMRGEYREFAAAPDKLLRFIRMPGQAVMQRGFDGKRAWEESPEHGVEILSGDRLAQVRRQAVLHPALAWNSMYNRISFKGRELFDGRQAVALSGTAPDGAEDILWFDAAGGLLLGIECDETFANGVKQRVRYLFEDYRTLGEVQVAHRIRYESPRMIWIADRGEGVQNVAIEDSQFQPPAPGQTER